MPFLPFAAALALVVWIILLLVLAVRTRTPPAPAGPAVSELGPEPPAIADLVTGGFTLCDEEAAAATVLDLATRGLLEVEEVGPELSLIRMRNRAPGDLRGHEQEVYDYLRRMAGRDGVVATEALARDRRRTRAWLRRFHGQVIREARDAGLARPRLTLPQWILIGLVALVPAIGTGVSMLIAFYVDSGFDVVGWLTVVLFFGALVWLPLMLIARWALGGVRGTEAGASAASYWLGVRAHLAGGRFGDQPPAAVTTYGRPLAYAAALGLAHSAVEGLPITEEGDARRAWSDLGGLWHPVRVRYPGIPRGWRRRPLFWGRRPWPVLLLTPVVAGLAYLVLLLATLVGILAAYVAFDLSLDVFDTIWPYLAPGLVVAVPAVQGLVRAVLGLVAPKRVITGQIVRLRAFSHLGLSALVLAFAKVPVHVRSYWIAVDEGRRGTIKAYGLTEELFGTLNEGDAVQMRVRPGLGRVHELSVTAKSDRVHPVM